MATVVEALAGLEEPLTTTEPAEPPLKPAPPPAKLTFEQANELTAGRIFELIAGRIVYKMPDDKHSEVQGLLCTELGIYFKANPIGRVRPEFTLRLWPDDKHESRLPDLSVILNESFKDERYGTRAPDLAIEIVSQYYRWNDLFARAELYLEKGSRVVWIVDPYQKGVMVITSNERLWVSDILTCPEVLPDFSINVQDIFSWPSASVKTAK
ncbi:MAG: Uma2 family endonuclease [candidate division KSB1 bacterium]|nr:Uma2 family endonuclease [candidate division KSB1 bacterium]MDZ7407123.1 Uma2 family endonuclease [candidate division KSB1 bacterium]